MSGEGARGRCSSIELRGECARDVRGGMHFGVEGGIAPPATEFSKLIVEGMKRGVGHAKGTRTHGLTVDECGGIEGEAGGMTVSLLEAGDTEFDAAEIANDDERHVPELKVSKHCSDGCASGTGGFTGVAVMRDRMVWKAEAIGPAVVGGAGIGSLRLLEQGAKLVERGSRCGYSDKAGVLDSAFGTRGRGESEV